MRSKRLIPVVLATTLGLTLTACGGPENTDPMADGKITIGLSLIHISEPTRRHHVSRMPSSA